MKSVHGKVVTVDSSPARPVQGAATKKCIVVLLVVGKEDNRGLINVDLTYQVTSNWQARKATLN